MKSKLLSFKDKLNNRFFRYGTVPILLFLLLAIFLFSLCAGRYNINVLEVLKILLSKIFPLDQTWPDTAANVVINLRVPRIIGAILVGGALSLSGATYQGIFKNQLVSPDLLGVSAGACVGAAIGILLHVGNLGMQIFAFAGGLLAVGLTVAIPKLMQRSTSITLVLAGIIVSGFMNSMIGLMKYLADPDTELAEITYWQLGSLANIHYSDLISVGPVIVIAAVILLAMSWRINILSLGEQEAQILGLDIRKERGLAILCATLMTASAVCISGTIAWVGLIIPHLARIFAGSNNERMMPVSFLLSAIFMIIIDTVARNLGGVELPISILTGSIGAPFFAWILIHERKDV